MLKFKVNMLLAIFSNPIVRVTISDVMVAVLAFVASACYVPFQLYWIIPWQSVSTKRSNNAAISLLCIMHNLVL